MEATRQRGSSMEDVCGNPFFSHSLDPALLVDDDRRCVDANAAACLFLRESIEAIRKLTLDDLTAPHRRSGLGAAWLRLLHGKSVPGQLLADMRLPDGASVRIDFCVTPHICPGRHLAVIGFPPARAVNGRCIGAAVPADNVLTKREREILTFVAHGHTGAQIASQLFLSPATVQTHVVNALIKLGAKNRAHGIALALRANEINVTSALLQR